MKVLLVTCLLLLVVLVQSQGTRKLRHVFSLTQVFEDSSYYTTPTIYVLSTTPKYMISGVLNVPYRAVSYPFTLGPMEGKAIGTASNIVPHNTGQQASTFIVEADGDVVVYGSSRYSTTYQDSYYVIPLGNLGYEYHMASHSYVSGYNNFISLSSISDETDVMVHFNKDFTHQSQVYNKDNPMNLSLNAFETFMFEAEFDITGTYIKSSQPFSVSCSATRSVISQYTNSLVEFPIPVESWGSYYLVTNFKTQFDYVIRLLTATSNTSVSLQDIERNSTTDITLEPGRYYEKNVQGVTLEISSSAPIMVTQYASSYPSMVTIPPLERAIHGPLLFDFTTSDPYYLTVWLSSRDTFNLLIDNATVSWEEVVADREGWAIVQIGISDTALYKTLSHADPGVKMTAIAYGNYYAHPLMYYVQDDNDIDTVPPSIHGCYDEPIEADLPPDQTNVAVHWIPPTSQDNSGLETTGENNYNPGDGFPFGTTAVVYTFEDQSGNKAECIFEVSVEDTTPPELVHCPSDIDVSTCADTVVLSWEEPVAVDKSNQVILKNASHSPGEAFPPGNSTVSYEFADPSGNEVVCSFVITVGAKACQSEAVIGLIVGVTILSVIIVLLVAFIGVMLFKQKKA